MIVVLPHGTCVDPETVKMILIRADRAKSGGMVFNVVMKTDADDNFHLIAPFDNRGEAEALAGECAKLINKGLGVDDDDDDSGDDGGFDSSDDDDDDDDDDW